jgi:hypothetical protein
MNIGVIFALFNYLLIDYKTEKSVSSQNPSPCLMVCASNS